MKTDIVAATKRYETWLASQVSIQTHELDYKHEQMASRFDAFPFFRGTYYRWAEIWPGVCKDLQSAPRVLAVGDLHVENFGTWRDREGRLVWGINDFDEVDMISHSRMIWCDWQPVPSSQPTAAPIRTRSGKGRAAPILSGYVDHLQQGGQPFVLEEDNLEMRSLATQADRDPVVFWKKMTGVLKQAPPDVSGEVQTVLKKDLQGTTVPCEIRSRPRIGMGSLGKPRYVALANIAGGWVAA